MEKGRNFRHDPLKKQGNFYAVCRDAPWHVSTVDALIRSQFSIFNPHFSI